MKYKDIKNIKVGDEFFNIVTENGILYHYKYIGCGNFENVDSKSIISRDLLINVSYVETKDKVLIIHFKESLNRYIENVFNLEKKITINKDKIKKINKKYNYLKDLYPEEFI
jgi:hypothetical protein